MQLLNEHGPVTAHAIVVGVGGQLYVHGGIKKRNGLQPVAILQRFDFETDKWMDLSSSKCPPLSHHAAFVTEDRYSFSELKFVTTCRKSFQIYQPSRWLGWKIKNT